MISIFLLVLIPIIFATLLYLFTNELAKKMTLIFQSCLFVVTIINFMLVKNYGPIIEKLGGWEGYIGITLRLDILSSVLIMLTAFLFLAMFFYNYSKEYVDKLFLFLLTVLEALIIAVFLSNDLFNVYVSMEVSTVIVSILIMFKKDSRSIYDGMIYLFLNIIAMLFFLFGVGFLYKTFGVIDMYEIRNRMHLIENVRVLIIPYALMITAVALKSALLPLFNWLPKAHATPSAPSVVSALLSGLYVKGGLYLFIRLQEMFNGVIDTTDFFIMTGFLTALIGIILALAQNDIKLILAYSTISQIGLIMIGLNYVDTASYWGAIYHILNHAIFKSVLFLTSGIIIEQYNTRDVREIRGVFKRLPVISVISIFAILGITGAPLFSGSIYKYLIHTEVEGIILGYGMLLINLGTVLYFMKYLTIFKGTWSREKSKIEINRIIVTSVLALICFIGGIYGTVFMKFLFNYEVVIDIYEYLDKALTYLLTLIFGVIIYKYMMVNLKVLNKIRELEISFNSLCLFITLFFCTVIFYLNIIY